MLKKAVEIILTFALLFAGIAILWVGATEQGSAIPGELLDARLNNLLLEHLYLWCRGGVGMLWSPTFFYPYEHVLAFGDNHFGTGLIYGIARFVGLSQERAFDLWFITAYPLNFLSAWYVLKRMNLGHIPAVFGAFVFTFSLPVLGQINHAQLGYRFAIPLAFFWLQQTLEGSGRDFLRSAGLFLFWTGWQFACSIYMGYFLCLASLAWAVGWLITGGRFDPDCWKPRDPRDRRGRLLEWIPGGVGLALILGTLIPYGIVSGEYHFKRQEWELEGMIPRIGSYLIADNSWFSSGLGKFAGEIPMRHEHQLFLGFFPIVLVGLGLIACFRKSSSPPWTHVRSAILCGSLLLLATTIVAGHSFYHLLIHLPLANALRSVSRITLVMLFPIAVISAGGIRYVQESIKNAWIRGTIFILLAAFLPIEISHFHFSTLSIAGMRERISKLHSFLPASIPKQSILFVEKDPREGDYLSEVDAMILAQELGLPTWNGYSGNFPPGHGDGRTYSDAVRQMAVYCLFRGLDDGTYRHLVQRILPVRCSDKAPERIPPLPTLVAKTDLERKDCEAILITPRKMDIIGENLIRVQGLLTNGGSVPLRSVSLLTHPVRFTWKWVPILGRGEETGFAMRRDLEWDLPAGGVQEFSIELRPPDKPGLYDLKVTLLEEGRRFLNDQGMKIPRALYSLSVSNDHKLKLVCSGGSGGD